MKIKLAAFVFLLAVISVNAQIYTPNGVIQGSSTNNNVGIGGVPVFGKLELFNTAFGTQTFSFYTNDGISNSRALLQHITTSNSQRINFTSSFSSGSGYANWTFATGNVGIGTTIPKNKLQIGEFNNGGVSKISIPGIYNFEEMKLGQYGNGLTGLEMITHSDQTKSFGVKLLAGTDTGVNGLLIQTADPATSAQTLAYTTKMVVNLNGNVGIGILNPLNKLDVNGTIHSKEVKVDMLDWSDFVFKKEYELPTLDQVEKHIREKGHLENIPSEEEVLKNGINLGEMNAKLLQKIEELTLYMIEMKKENEEIKKENKEMKEDISNLKLNQNR